jgi:hypothetical protein
VAYCDDAASGRWNADRSAAIRSVCDRGQGGCNSGRGAAGGSARGIIEVPRIARYPPQRDVGHTGIRKFRGRAATVHNRAGLEQTLHRWSGIIRTKLLENFGSQGRNLALDRMKVLDGDRDSFQWPQTSVAFGIAPLGSLACWRARSKKVVVKALILGLTSSQRAITEFMSSTGDSFLAPKASTASVAVIKHRYSFRRPSVLSFAYAAPIKSFRIAARTSPTDATAKTASPS